MTHQKIFAALLCGALLLSGCAGGGGAPAASSAPGSSVEAAGRPLSELEQIALQVEAWEKAGAYDDEGAYREALLRVLELARAEDDGSYRCEDPSQLSEDQLKALTDAALRQALKTEMKDAALLIIAQRISQLHNLFIANTLSLQLGG